MKMDGRHINKQRLNILIRRMTNVKVDGRTETNPTMNFRNHRKAANPETSCLMEMDLAAGEPPWKTGSCEFKASSWKLL